MLSRYNPIDIENTLKAVSSAPPFPPAADRDAWQKIRRAAGEERVGQILAQAETDAKTPIPALPATLYLECERTGQREGYEDQMSWRRTMLGTMTLAECLEGKGRFLDPLLDVAWAICEESSWVYPAHQFQLANKERPRVDLGAAMTALDLAELDLLLGASLDPALGKRIRYEVDQRCITPYITRHDLWWLYSFEGHTVNNWSAVCNAGVVGAALYLETDKARLAEIVAKAARSLDDYLETFDKDGGSSEGPGYWGYGFGHYVVLAHLVEQRTEGKVSFLEGEQIRNIAQFPLRTLLSPGIQVNFSDARRAASFHPGLLTYLSQRLELPDLMRLAREQFAGAKYSQTLTWALRDLFWHPSAEPPGDYKLAKHDWYGGMMWMIARSNPEDPNAPVLAAKGGHNDEMHNHNDVGAFIVQVNGEAIIAETGIGRYTRAYFGPTRYDHFPAASRGHSVPLPNGKEQVVGKEYAATLLEHRADAAQDSLSIEMKDAYPADADLASLRRTIALHRESPRNWVELTDEARFATKPGLLESALITFGAAEVGAGGVTLRGERATARVVFDPGVATARVETEKEVDLMGGRRDVQRVLFAWKEPKQEGVLRLRIEIMP